MNVITKLTNHCQRAAQVFITDETRKNYETRGIHMLNAPPIKPVLPTTKDAATPHILLTGPFKDDPGLAAVSVYVGIGFIEVRDLQSGARLHQIEAFDGDGVEARRSYLSTALQLYFNVKPVQKVEA